MKLGQKSDKMDQKQLQMTAGQYYQSFLESKMAKIDQNRPNFINDPNFGCIFFIAFLECRDFNSCKKCMKKISTTFSLYNIVQCIFNAFNAFLTPGRYLLLPHKIGGSISTSTLLYLDNIFLTQSVHAARTHFLRGGGSKVTFWNFWPVSRKGKIQKNTEGI